MCSKEQLYTLFARIGKALASPARLELLDLLAQGERPVEDLARGKSAMPSSISSWSRRASSAKRADGQ